MFHFKPAIWRDDTLYELPRPIRSLRIQDEWDFQRFKVPLVDGDLTVGSSRDGVDIIVSGQIGSQSGELRLTEADMFSELEALRTALDRSAGDAPYHFFLYHDPGAETYRSFRECTTVRFEYDLSKQALFAYSAVIHAGDPTIYSDAPL
ncbi:hypothetical protein Mal4_53960 [Maioricimonas rarisocia]|uniref:Uncharacterized protein n=1 Tax=Maioricimonas rarisocia TaxID=2528026 RepID=A0A517ZEY7_9PLAN|nr:hypothetical protein [Maioricimonas rarisocia]QDU41031.1 hypothetical protein Mal4_53960 [Maioricimonas rarisocia]